jgi:hypothetical protein
VTPEDVGQIIDPEATVNAAIQTTRKSNLIADMARRLKLYFNGENLALVGEVDQQKFDDFVAKVAGELDVRPINMGLSIDGENIEAVFDSSDREQGLAFRQAIPSDLMSLLEEWTRGFCPLNTIERSLSSLIDRRGSNGVQRISTTVTAQGAMEMLEPGDILVDCTGSKSLLRDHLEPHSGAAVDGANTVTVRLEYAMVVTFLFGRPYICNELCKYYKNAENLAYKFIQSVDRTCYDGDVSHVTGIVVISADEYAEMPARFDGQWLRGQFPSVAASMDRFIDKVRQEAQGDVVGDLEIVRIPLGAQGPRSAGARSSAGA